MHKNNTSAVDSKLIIGNKYFKEIKTYFKLAKIT